MVICGIKLTHDGAIALIDNGKLVFSYEMEKIANMPRHSEFWITMGQMEAILADHGYRFEQIDQVVIDGWDDWNPEDIGSTIPAQKRSLHIPLNETRRIPIHALAGYGHIVGKEENILAPSAYSIKEHAFDYKSYMHVASHVIGAYCTSSFAQRKEDSLVLVWDGGMPPQLFHYKYEENIVLNLGFLFPFTGYMYINFAHAFEPYCLLKKEMSLAGKLMAYIAKGKEDAEILERYRVIYADLMETVKSVTLNIDIIAILTAEFIKRAGDVCTELQADHANMLTTFHAFIQELLLKNLAQKVAEYPSVVKNLCFAGGSALNIKWNSSIRNSGLFHEVWVPPFPNDSGSALGTACCEMILKDNHRALQWNVYSGPVIKEEDRENALFAVKNCSLKELALLLHEYDEPVVFLNGLAELGPRALGNRSILAPAVNAGMKNELNRIKGREDYRPVAPICLESDAPGIFDPGSPDPYMLYEHLVRPDWKEKVPAICHLDGTARLQTVNKRENPEIFELLNHYKNLSGVPLLCNTSANFNGKGFFPNVQSVMQWGQVNFIWSSGKLYYKKGALRPEPVAVEQELVK